MECENKEQESAEDLTGKLTKKLLEETCGFELPTIKGYFILLRVYVQPEEFIMTSTGEKTSIIKPDFFKQREKYQSTVGLVIDMGPVCYRSERLGKKNWANIGDWVFVDRTLCKQFSYNDVPLMIIEDESIMCTVPDPAKVKLF